jgi:hypothetical protein
VVKALLQIAQVIDLEVCVEANAIDKVLVAYSAEYGHSFKRKAILFNIE